MRHNLVCQTPPTVTVRVKWSASRSQQKALIRLKRPNSKDCEENCGKMVPSHIYRCPERPCLVIQRQEMTAYFKLFGRLIITGINVPTEQYETIKQVCLINSVIWGVL